MTYKPKNLTAEQIERIKQLIVEHKDWVYDEDRIKESLETSIESVRHWFAKEYQNQSFDPKKECPQYCIEPFAYWYQGQMDDRIWSDIDKEMPRLKSKKGIPVEMTIEYINTVIDKENELLHEWQKKALEGISMYEIGLHLTTFRSLVKTNFYQSLIEQLKPSKEQVGVQKQIEDTPVKPKSKKQTQKKEVIDWSFLIPILKKDGINLIDDEGKDWIAYSRGQLVKAIIICDAVIESKKVKVKDRRIVRKSFMEFFNVEISDSYLRRDVKYPQLENQNGYQNTEFKIEFKMNL